MFPIFVVPVKPVCQVSGKLVSRFVSLQVDPFVFQGAPESFDEDIILEASLAVHADPDVPGFQDGGEGFAGKLASLIGVEYLRGAVFEQSFFQRLNAEPSIKCVGQAPGEYLSGSPVHDCYQVHEPTMHGNVRYVGCPDLIGPVNGHAPQQVGIDRMFRLPSAGARLG